MKAKLVFALGSPPHAGVKTRRGKARLIPARKQYVGFHGWTGKVDRNLGDSTEGILGICIDGRSISITLYIEYYVFGVGHAPTPKVTGNSTCLTYAPSHQ